MGARSGLAGVYYDLSVMLEAGLPVLRALDVVIEGHRGRFKHTLSEVRQSVSKGSSLAEAMGKHRKVFPALDRMLIEAAETSGSLDESFKMLSEWHEFVHRIIGRIISGLMYPVFILHAAAFIFPLPALILGQIGLVVYATRVVWIVIWLYLLLAIVAFRVYHPESARPIRLPLDYLVLRIPILGSAIYHLCVSRFARAFGMMYKAGVPIGESTQRATRAVGNEAVANLFKGTIDSVRRGGMAWEGLSRRLPAEYRHLWQVGEESGEMDRAVDKIAQISADRADFYFRGFARGFPILIYVAIMGLIIYMIFTLFNQVYGNLPTF